MSFFEMPTRFADRPLPLKYKVDFVCWGEIIVEVKAVESITDRHVSQVINYLKASKMKRALLLNFGATSLQHKRLVN